MQLRTNTMAINAHRNIGITGSGMMQAMHRLSSGFRINTAADDPAGLAISETMRAQIRGLDQASRNAQDGISMLGTAEAAVISVQSMLQRIREIIIQAANDTNNVTNREALQMEVNELMAEIDLVSSAAMFNNRPLLSGSHAPGTSTGDDLWLQTGPNPGQGMTVNIGAVSVYHIDQATFTDAALGSSTDPNFRFAFHALRSFPHSSDPSSPPMQPGFVGMDGVDIARFQPVLDAAIDHINMERASLGAMQNRLEFTTRSLDVASENLQDAESRIRNADMALEMMRFVRYQVLQQTGMMVLAQANRAPGTFLELLG